MLTPLQNYFHYSRGERRGTVVLSGVIILLLGFYFVRDWIEPIKENSLDVDEFQTKIASFESLKKEEAMIESNELFMFDPNTIGVEEWVLLGFSEKQAESIENYKASGAEFKIKKDVLKLFMVDEYKYMQLEPYIDLPENYPKHKYSSNYQESTISDKPLYAVLLAESETPVYSGFEQYEEVYYTKKNGNFQYLIMPFEKEEEAEALQDSLNIQQGKVVELYSIQGCYPISNKTFPKKEPTKKLIIDLNSADTTALKTLYGIGSGYANRIVNYRESLGGFVSLDQLSEVYGLQEETIESILPYLILENIAVQKIDINSASIDDLKAHPYIDWKVANSIVQIRNNYGKFASVEGITKSVLIDDVLFQKIKSYLEAK